MSVNNNYAVTDKGYYGDFGGAFIPEMLYANIDHLGQILLAQRLGKKRIIAETDMVTRFQAVISEEIKSQLQEKTGTEYPDYVIACVGGGSNAAGAFYHFLEHEETQLVLAEAAGEGIDTGRSAATSILGTQGIIHGCKTLLMQNSDGQIVEPHSVSAGLDYPGIGPLHAHLKEYYYKEYNQSNDNKKYNKQ